VPVAGFAGSGNFLEGLNNAGVPPEGVLWAPTRYVANGGSDATGTDEIIDLLWLPTEREMHGAQNRSSPLETEQNQAWLEYYPASDTIPDNWYRIKNTSTGGDSFYWEGSPRSNNLASFCSADYLVHTNFNGADRTGGVAPAFCVR
jgi:hypothetical protein